MPKQVAAVACWDFFYNSESLTENTLPTVMEFKKILKSHAKKWIFQLERGAQGRYHYQVRVSLKDKVRNFAKLEGLNNKMIQEMPTAACNMNQFNGESYQAKDDCTRVEGPWCYNDATLTGDFAMMGIHSEADLWPWQKAMIQLAKLPDLRKINMLIDTKGCNGKSVLFKYMGIMKLGKELPMCNDFQGVMRMAYDVGEFPCYMIDMPRAIKKDKLLGLFGGIEKLKGGYCYDDRNTFRDRYQFNPNIIVATNQKPDLSLLTADRWAFWVIEENELKPYPGGGGGAVAENPTPPFS